MRIPPARRRRARVLTGTTEIRVLTWNLFHGRDGAPEVGATWRSIARREPVAAGRRVHLNRKVIDLMGRLVARAEPDLCALQEVPPLSVRELANATRMSAVWCLTGPRLGPVGLRGRLGRANPDLWRSHEGNANVLLVGRGFRLVPSSARSARHAGLGAMLRTAHRLGMPASEVWRWSMEPRRMVLARVRTPAGREMVAACLHAHDARDPRAVGVELRRAAGVAVGVAGDDPLVIAGDLNVDGRTGAEALADLAALGLEGAEADRPLGLDRILYRGLEVVHPPRRLDVAAREVGVRWRGGSGLLRLSDHDPVTAVLRLPGP